MEDLQPYVCVLHDGEYNTPDPRNHNHQTWIEHLQNRHQPKHSWQCPLCLETTGDSIARFARHVSRHLDDVALAALPQSYESDQESDSDEAQKDYSNYKELVSQQLKQQQQAHTVDMDQAGAKKKAEEFAKDLVQAASNARIAAESNAKEAENKQLPIKFRDAVGRKFSFPWHLCRTWKVRSACSPPQALSSSNLYCKDV